MPKLRRIPLHFPHPSMRPSCDPPGPLCGHNKSQASTTGPWPATRREPRRGRVPCADHRRSSGASAGANSPSPGFDRRHADADPRDAGQETATEPNRHNCPAAPTEPAHPSRPGQTALAGDRYLRPGLCNYRGFGRGNDASRAESLCTMVVAPGRVTSARDSGRVHCSGVGTACKASVHVLLGVTNKHCNKYLNETCALLGNCAQKKNRRSWTMTQSSDNTQTRGKHMPDARARCWARTASDRAPGWQQGGGLKWALTDRARGFSVLRRVALDNSVRG